MEEQQFQQELTIIRNMISRTRRETFQSGYLFIIPGVIFLISVFVMGILEISGHAQLVQSFKWIPFVVMFIASLSIGLWEGNRGKSKVWTYTRLLFTHLWGSCGIVIMLIVFVVPHMHYNSAVTPLLILGLGFYVTGAIYELRLVQVSGVVLCIGTCLLGFVHGNVRLLIWTSTIFFGYVLPGILLNRQFRNGGADRGE